MPSVTDWRRLLYVSHIDGHHAWMWMARHFLVITGHNWDFWVSSCLKAGYTMAINHWHPINSPHDLHGSSRSEVQPATSAIEGWNSWPVFGRKNLHSQLPSSKSSKTPTGRRGVCPGREDPRRQWHNWHRGASDLCVPQTRWSIFNKLRHITSSKSLCQQSSTKSHGFKH